MLIRITHPFHPWYNRQFILDHQATIAAERRFVLLDEQGLTYDIPITWTDYVAPDPCVQIGQGKLKLRADDLVNMVEVVASWRRERRA